jgi:hypothetical protein
MRLLALAFVAVVFGQPSGPYAGDWSADFHGTTYVRLAFSDKDGAAQGSMSIAESVHVDKQGNIDGVTEASSTLKPLFDVRRSGNVVSFSYPSANDVDKFELRLVDTNTAELTLLLPEEARQELAADGIPAPKPFRLTKSR